MDENIYKNMTTEEKDILNELLDDRIVSRVAVNNAVINNYRPWMAIFSEYLSKVDKNIKAHANRYYYKQDHLDHYYPTNPNTDRICEPFSTSAPQSIYEFYYIDTSTGTKIYEYASALCKANVGFIDKQSLAVSLTKHKNHRVKIVQSNQTVWILSNDIDDEFVRNSLALFPFLFTIEELLKDQNVIDCCKAITKQEPIKQYFTNIFEKLTEIRNQKKRDIIKNALNAKTLSLIRKTEREINNLDETIRDYEQRLTAYYERKNVYLAQKLGLESQKQIDDTDVSDVLDFVSRNRYIQALSLIKNNSYSNEADVLQLNIHAPISIYESEPLERQINNRITPYNEHTKEAKILKAFKRIFIDEELQMICQTFVKIDITSSTIDAGKEANRKCYTDFARIHQPHLTRYDCWGDNKTAILQALKDTDLIGAFNNILIAVQNINFTDSTVLTSWVEAIANSNHLYTLKSCLSKADGNLWSIEDIVQQIEREEANEEIGKPELIDQIPKF